MKYVLASLAGLLLGAAAAAAVVYFNPLTANAVPPVLAQGGWRLDYSFPGPGVLTHTHGGRLPSARVPRAAPELWEETIRSSALTSIRLEDARDGAPAWATRISVPSTRTNLIFNGLVVGDYWLISKPGAGSLFMSAYTNVWPVAKDTYVRVNLLRRPWGGPASYSPTLRSEAPPVLRGVTGRFAGAVGRGFESFEVTAYEAAGGSMSGRLMLDLGGAAPAE